MKFLMLVCTDPSAAPGADAGPDIETWFDDVTRRGVRTDGDRLQPASASRVVRVRDGRTVVTEGPFAEVVEQVVGYDVLECADYDEAVDVASRHPMAYGGLLELRPVWPMDEG